jgi:hypothetical protein
MPSILLAGPAFFVLERDPRAEAAQQLHYPSRRLFPAPPRAFIDFIRG